MALVYKYRSKAQSGLITGYVSATSRAAALLALKRSGIKPIGLSIDPIKSVMGQKSGQFNPVELSRLYTTIGRRLARGKQLAEGLGQALEYISDSSLKAAVSNMQQAVAEGTAAHDAMLAAGFPRRDAMMVKATSAAGRVSEAFESLGHEVKRNAALSKSIKQLFFMPTMMLAFMSVFIWVALSFFAPLTMQFLKNAGTLNNLSGFLKGYFSVAETFNASWVFSSVVYFGVLLGAYISLRSEFAQRMYDKWPALRDLSIKSDQAALWASYRQMYDAAVPSTEAASMAASAAKRGDSRKSFEKLSAQLAAGASLDAATAAAGFPKFVVGGVFSAVSAGNLSDGLRDMTAMLEEDVASATEKFKESMRLISVVVMGFGVLGIFMVTYYPILSATLKNA